MTGDLTPQQIRARSLARADWFERFAAEHEGTGFADSGALLALAASIRAAVAH